MATVFSEIDTSLSDAYSFFSIGDYSTTLSFVQTSVPVTVDETLNMLLSFLAQPIVQKIVDGALLGCVLVFLFSSVWLTASL